MSIAISAQYIQLKRDELSLALDYAQKKAEEKERIKELKAQEREEKRVQKEIEEARARLNKEKTHYQNALAQLEEQLKDHPDNPAILEKHEKLLEAIADTDKAIADVDYREANKRAGYVYIISNIGAFGEGVYKIGIVSMNWVMHPFPLILMFTP